MAQAAGLCWNVEALPDGVEQRYDPHVVLDAIGRRIDADHRVANAKQESVDQAGGNSARIIGWMVGLQPRGEPSDESDCVTEGGRDAAFGRNDDEILRAHDFRYRGNHLRGQTRSQCGQAVVRVSSSHSRNAPTVIWDTAAKATGS